MEECWEVEAWVGSRMSSPHHQHAILSSAEIPLTVKQSRSKRGNPKHHLICRLRSCSGDKCPCIKSAFERTETWGNLISWSGSWLVLKLVCAITLNSTQGRKYIVVERTLTWESRDRYPCFPSLQLRNSGPWGKSLNLSGPLIPHWD